MHSSKSVQQSDSPIKNKAKGMAAKYQKYCQKQQRQQQNKHIKQIGKWIKKIDTTAKLIWNSIMPKSIRGPITPYQALQRVLPSSAKKSLQNLPISKSQLTQSVKNNRINIIITYTLKTVIQTLNKLDNNQQINAIINKKGQIFLIKIQNNQQDQIASKVKQLIESIGQSSPYQQQIFVLWKGLYQQIVVIAHFQLSDLNLCQKIIKAVEDREDYQSLIRHYAHQEQPKNNLQQQITMQKLCQQQSTGISRCNSNDQ